MNEETIYKKIILGSDKTDGETPLCVELGEEKTCLILWETGPDGRELLAWFNTWKRSEAIEQAVKIGAEYEGRRDSLAADFVKRWEGNS